MVGLRMTPRRAARHMLITLWCYIIPAQASLAVWMASRQNWPLAGVWLLIMAYVIWDTYRDRRALLDFDHQLSEPCRALAMPIFRRVEADGRCEVIVTKGDGEFRAIFNRRPGLAAAWPEPEPCNHTWLPLDRDGHLVRYCCECGETEPLT